MVAIELARGTGFLRGPTARVRRGVFRPIADRLIVHEDATPPSDGQKIKGISEPLPAGEALLWQGAPRWQALALRTFHARKVAIYFSVLMIWRGATLFADGDDWINVFLNAALGTVPVALAAVGLLLLLAWFASRTTIYAITTRRIVMRVGIALPITVNLPFSAIESVGLKLNRDGTGDIPIALSGSDRLAWLHLWPHVRPWKIAHPQPMLRSVSDAAAVAQILAGALAGSASAMIVSAAMPIRESASPARRALPHRATAG